MINSKKKGCDFMPYCKKCGNYLNDGVNICNKCGTHNVMMNTQKRSGTQSNNVPFSQKNSRNYSKSSDRMILTAGVNNAYLTKSIIFSLIGIMLLIVLLYLPISLYYDFFESEYNAHIFEMKRETKQEYEFLLNFIGTIRTTAVVIIIADIIVNILKNIKITKNNICVTESGIYGNASTVFGFAAVSFNLSFNQITRIKRKFGRVVIWRTTGSKLICSVDNHNEVYEMISKKIEYKQ